MLYIITALKSEAQAFVDKYKLQNYKNEDMTIFISGIGKANMHKTSIDVLKLFQKNDTILNVGICGASNKYFIGELIDGLKTNITCVDNAIDTQDTNYEIVDMESDAFLDSTKDIKNVFIFKVVSDHFEPHTVTKDKTKKLIFDNIDKIMKAINYE